MSINPNMQLVPFTSVKMLNETIKLIRMPKLNAQFIIYFANIYLFNLQVINSFHWSLNVILCFLKKISV